MARRSGVSESAAGRIWRKFGLEPHLADGFKLSADPLLAEKAVDVAGLCHDPPEKAVVLCVDEKSQVQALDRSQPVLPMMPGMPERRTRGYARRGVTSLFAAFDIADGTVISGLHPRFHVHFTPTGSSRVNQAERWFGYLTGQKVRRGAHKSVQALEADIRDWVEHWNENPRPFAWTKTAEEILNSLAEYLSKISGGPY
jgi:hypothetical protein